MLETHQALRNFRCVQSKCVEKEKKIHFQYGLYGFQSLPWIFLSEYLKINNADNKHLFVNINLIKFSLSDEQEY